jgi:hypothetical protein
MASLIGVHGVHNYRAGHDPSAVAQGLATIWREALSQGPLGIDAIAMPFTAAYYAHLLREPGRQSGDAGLDGLPSEVEEMIRAWLNEWDLDPGVSQGIGTMPLRQALGILAGHLGFAREAVERFAALFFPEADRYLRGDTPHRTIARTEVANAIIAAPPPRIVLAHSLGSVVTYEALHANPHIDVELFVTLGSPLAMPIVIFDRLDPAPRDGWGQAPPGVRQWVNLADKGDLIAIPRGGIKARFQGIDHDLEAIINWADFHKIANYLKTDALAQALRPYCP